MDISFVIPARNEGAALGETISHLCRTCRNHSFEIVLVDDASDTPQVNQRGIPAELVYHRCATRVGVANARNLGASRSRGRLLFFLDAHVCFSNGWIDEMIRSGVMDDDVVVGSATRLHDEFDLFRAIARGTRRADSGGAYYGWCLSESDPLRPRVNRLCKSESAFAVPYVGAASLAVSRRLFEKLGGFERELGGYGNLEDAELAMRCWSFGYQVKLVPSAVCHHYTDPEKQRQKNRTNKGGHPLQHPQYDGTLENVLRVIYLHFPDDLANTILSQPVMREFRGKLKSGFPARIVTEQLMRRKAWIESRRRFDREWLMRRFTTV